MGKNSEISNAISAHGVKCGNPIPHASGGVATHYRSSDLRFILIRYFGPHYLKKGHQFLGVAHATLTSYVTGTRKIPHHIWIRLPEYAPFVKARQRKWVQVRKERLDFWLANQEAYVDNTVLAMKSYAEEGRKARASRKGNQLNPT